MRRATLIWFFLYLGLTVAPRRQNHTTLFFFAQAFGRQEPRGEHADRLVGVSVLMLGEWCFVLFQALPGTAAASDVLMSADFFFFFGGDSYKLLCIVPAS